MPVRKAIPEKTVFTSLHLSATADRRCARWLPLFELINSYNAVCKWFDVLKEAGHYIIGYTIMPNHIHAIIAFNNKSKTINSIVGNGKRFMAYDLVTALEDQHQTQLLNQLKEWVNKTQQSDNKQHEVFEPSFDWKECRTEKFITQKLNYPPRRTGIHNNPCVAGLCIFPEEYKHSSAKFYITGEQGIYPVTSFMELRDIDLTK